MGQKQSSNEPFTLTEYGNRLNGDPRFQKIINGDIDRVSTTLPKTVRDLLKMMDEAEKLALSCKEALGGVELKFENIRIEADKVYNIPLEKLNKSSNSISSNPNEDKITIVKVHIAHKDAKGHDLVKLMSLKDLHSYAQEVEWIKHSKAISSEASGSNVLFSECPICMDKPIDVVLPCAHAMCQQCHSSWMASNSTCPLCRSETNDPEGNDIWVLAESTEEENKNQSMAEAARVLTFLRSLPDYAVPSTEVGDEV